MPTPHHPPAAERRVLRKLGADIRDARRRRRLPMAVVAERAFTSRSTLKKVEAGNANVSIGIYAAVLQALGLLDGLGEIADIARDSVGQALASAELPKRVRLMRTPGPSDHGCYRSLYRHRRAYASGRPGSQQQGTQQRHRRLRIRTGVKRIADLDRFAPLA